MTRNAKIVPNGNHLGEFSLSLQIMEDDLEMMEDDMEIMEDNLEIMEDDQKCLEDIHKDGSCSQKKIHWASTAVQILYLFSYSSFLKFGEKCCYVHA
jgi:GR25 family glycosyltransferase involved in LPS biosynthesis